VLKNTNVELGAIKEAEDPERPPASVASAGPFDEGALCFRRKGPISHVQYTKQLDGYYLQY